MHISLPFTEFTGSLLCNKQSIHRPGNEPVDSVHTLPISLKCNKINKQTKDMQVSKYTTVTRFYFPRNSEYLHFLLYELSFINKKLLMKTRDSNINLIFT